MLYVYGDVGHMHLLSEDGDNGPVRIILHPRQFELFRMYFGKRPIEVCSANVTKTCDGPTEVLDAMYECRLSRSCGGWRPLSDPEIYSVYLARINALEEMQRPGLRPEVQQSLAKHPLIAAGATYAYNNILTLPLIILMQEIYDILRFSPCQKHGMTPLKKHFGLSRASSMTKLLNVPMITTVEQTRTSIALNAWKMQPFGQFTREQAEADPKSFLFRLFFDNLETLTKTQPEEEAKAVALWQSTLRFMMYVSRLWLHGLGIERFEPERFFERKDEIESFLNYINPINKFLDRTPDDE